MDSNSIRKKFLKYFKDRRHAIVPSSSLVPEKDTTTLFTGSGMQPLLPYLLGEKHPAGKRVADSQKSFRVEDIDEVGDNRHTTFFEMLGNWSFGDYFKEEQLPWVFGFLTEEIGLDPEKIYVTVFAGDKKNNIPRDEESAKIWKKLFAEKGIDAKEVEPLTVERGGELGMQDGRIFYYDSKKNWWSRVGPPGNMPAKEPGGPDSEMFYEFQQVEHDKKFGKHCHPNCDCGRFLEIGNSVFMEYKKREDGTFEKLSQRNVDFGGGLERMAAASADDPDIFRIDAFLPIIAEIKSKAQHSNTRSERIIADHLRASVFLISDGVIPSNKDRGYPLRRLIRRAVMHSDHIIGLPLEALNAAIDIVVDFYIEAYPDLTANREIIRSVFIKERNVFAKAYAVGLRATEKILIKSKLVSGPDAFFLSATHGFPIDLVEELAAREGGRVDRKSFEEEFKKHQEISRAGQEKKFGGHGLILNTGELKAGNEEEMNRVLRLHTATHLLQRALREVLGAEVRQMGSDITPERTRFDFAYPRKMTEEEKKNVEELVNQKIKEDLPVQFVELPKAEAEKSGALYFFKEKYPERVKVYYVGKDLKSAWSKEFCGGPHVVRTGIIGKFMIAKEEAVGAGARRIRGALDE